MPLSARADPMTAASAAVAKKSAFMLWITPLRAAPPTKSIGTAETSRRWRQLGALTLRCGEISSHQKTGLDVGILKSAVADPADVLAGYVSKMWSQARKSFALDGHHAVAIAQRQLGRSPATPGCLWCSVVQAP